MFKNLSLFLLVALSFQGNSLGNVIKVDLPLSSPWLDHAMDFLKLVEMDKVINVALSYLSDPEVFGFVTFVLSDEFKKTIWEFESIAEFKEAMKFLADKGYEVEGVMNLINNALELPPFEPKLLKSDTVAKGTGMKDFIEDMMAILPINEFKELFEKKLETHQEVKELFDTINSEEFLGIMRRMSKNPKFDEFKKTFEAYGFDFKYLCNIAKDIFGDYYQGVFCDDILG